MLKRPSSSPVLSVGQLARELSDRLQSEWPALWVKGEISGLKLHGSSGHRYFTIKDREAQFQAVFWRGRAQSSATLPEDGMLVEALVRLVFYGPGGRLQLDVQALRPSGQGHLMQALLELKERLLQEGLFDPERKRPLPAFPQRIGLLTARDGAALQDMIRVLHRRQPGIQLFLQPTPVQGPDSGPHLARNLRALSRRVADLKLDLVIIGRGGGSFEDLFGFNHEDLVRAIRECPVPVISAVGHEVDTGLSDLAADLRAATPSMAGELAVPDIRDLLELLDQQRLRMEQGMRTALGRARAGLKALVEHRALAEPGRRFHEAAQRIDQLEERLNRALGHRRKGPRERLPELERRLRKGLLRLHAESAERVSGWPERLTRHLQRFARQRSEELALAARRQERALRSRIAESGRQLDELARRLKQLDLARIETAALRLGMARVLTADGDRVHSARELQENDKLELVFHDGRRQARVTKGEAE